MGNGASVGLSNLLGSTGGTTVTLLPTSTPPKRPTTRVDSKTIQTGSDAKLPVVVESFDGGGTQLAVHGSTFISELKRQVRQRDIILERCAAEIADLRRLVNARDAEIARLKAETNKFKSVLDAKVPAGGIVGSYPPTANGTSSGPIPILGDRVKSDLLATINEEAVMIGQEASSKKQGVSGESAQTGHGVDELRRFDKDFKYAKLMLSYHIYSM